jgi:two-component system, NarL family, sensor histidine kinase UhpB
MRSELSLPLFWRVCLINGAVFALGTLVLVLSPATISATPLWSEIVVLSIGLAVIFVLNGVLLRSVLRPLDRLTRVMADIDLRHPGRRLEEAGAGPARPLVAGFNAMLKRLENERTASTTRALHAQEAERQRIAQELHDEVGQSLTAVLLGLKQAIDIAPPEVAAELELVRDTTRTSLEEVRRISQRLRPGVLTDLGLLNSLSSLGSDLTARTGVPVHRGFLPGLPTLPPEAELVVYRVAQEALTNVARHARAQTVRLGLTRRGDTLILRVADDGIGHANAAVGAGIQGMQERAQMVGGRLQLRPREGGGTEVLLEIPIPEPPT